MSAPFSALRRPRPLSVSGHRRTASVCLSSPTTTQIRWASLAPFSVDSASPPSPPLTLEQANKMKKAQHQQHQQQHQTQLESVHRSRQQQELQHLLAKDRVHLHEQKSLSRWQIHTEERAQHRQRQDVKKALVLDLEYQQQLHHQPQN